MVVTSNPAFPEGTKLARKEAPTLQVGTVKTVTNICSRLDNDPRGTVWIVETTKGDLWVNTFAYMEHTYRELKELREWRIQAQYHPSTTFTATLETTDWQNIRAYSRSEALQQYIEMYRNTEFVKLEIQLVQRPT